MTQPDLTRYRDDLSQIELFPAGKLFRISFDPNINKLKIIAANYSALEELRNAFSVPNPNAFFVKQYGYRAESTLYVINKFGYFDAGLIFDILAWIKNNYGDMSVLAISQNAKNYIDDYITPLKKEYSGKDFDISNISDDTGRNNELRKAGKHEYEFRDYQASAIEYLLMKGYGRGLIECPTGSGKSFILANFVWNVLKNIDRNYKSLILVPNKQLVEQFYKDLIDYGYDEHLITRFTAGLKGANKFNKDAKIIIANRQYVFVHEDQLPDVDVLICDEVHQCLSEATRTFIDRVPCKIKIGCSGTLPRDKFNRWQLEGMFGRTVFTEQIVKLQAAGYISKLKITLLKINDSVVKGNKNLLFHVESNKRYRPDEFGYSDVAFNDAHRAEKEYFRDHYLELYEPVLNYLNTLDENILVLFDQIEVGSHLFERAKEILSNKKVHYIDGSVDVKTREDVRQAFEASGNNVLFAQVSIMSTGINIKRLNHICFAESSKSFSRNLQAIGRTLRLHEKKSEAHLIDIVYCDYKYSSKHYTERKAIYKSMYNKSKPDETIEFTI